MRCTRPVPGPRPGGSCRQRRARFPGRRTASLGVGVRSHRADRIRREFSFTRASPVLNRQWTGFADGLRCGVPGADLPHHRLPVRDAPGGALPGEDVCPGLRHVKPAAVLRRVGGPRSGPRAATPPPAECLVEGRQPVGVGLSITRTVFLSRGRHVLSALTTCPGSLRPCGGGGPSSGNPRPVKGEKDD